ncbi:MAG: pyridoxamine 5'-phosphate oxidase family protein [Mycobacteriaceae bacterium]
MSDPSIGDPSTRVSRLSERQRMDRADLDAVLDATPLAVVAFVRDSHPVALPIGFARLGDEVVIHGSTGSPWLCTLATGVPASVCVTLLDGVLVARSGFESSFHYRSAVLFGGFTVIGDDEKDDYLRELTDSFIPGRTAELRASSTRELAATQVLAIAIGADNWSVKVADGWPEDDPEDVASGVWAGVIPIETRYRPPLRAPDCDEGVPVPASVRGMTGLSGA